MSTNLFFLVTTQVVGVVALAWSPYTTQRCPNPEVCQGTWTPSNCHGSALRSWRACISRFCCTGLCNRLQRVAPGVGKRVLHQIWFSFSFAVLLCKSWKHNQARKKPTTLDEQAQRRTRVSTEGSVGKRSTWCGWFYWRRQRPPIFIVWWS